MTIKLNKILIAFIFLLASAKGAFCYTLTNDEIINSIKPEIQKQTLEQLKEYSFINKNDVKISILGVPYNSINVKGELKPKIEVQSQNKFFQKNSPKRIIIKDSSGNVAKTFPINVQTQVFGNVLTAKNIISYNQEINQNNTQFEKKEISSCLDKVIVELTENKIAKRNYQKGNIVLSDSIKQKAVIQKDSLVDIIFSSDNGLKIKLQGKALKDGSIGDTILVRSDKYNKVYNAKVSSSNEVIVRI